MVSVLFAMVELVMEVGLGLIRSTQTIASVNETAAAASNIHLD